VSLLKAGPKLKFSFAALRELTVVNNQYGWVELIYTNQWISAEMVVVENALKVMQLLIPCGLSMSTYYKPEFVIELLSLKCCIFETGCLFFAM
jgi:hypothetical protein